MTDERLNQLSLICIESAILHELDFSNVISNFAKVKTRKVNLL